MYHHHRIVVIALLLSCAIANWLYPYSEHSLGKLSKNPIDTSFQSLAEVSYSAAGCPWSFLERIDSRESHSRYKWNIQSLAGDIAIWGLVFAMAWWHSGARIANSKEFKEGRKWRCSLADLFVAMLLVASLFGYFVRNREQYAESQKLVDKIRRNQGISSEAFYWPRFLFKGVLLNAVLPRERIICVSLENPPDALLKEVVAQPKLQSLCISGAGYSLAELRPLLENPHLRYLRLSGRDLDKETMELIGQMKSLQALSLSSTNVTDLHLSHMKEMPLLRCLDLGRTRILLQDSVAKPWMQTVRYLRLPRSSIGGTPSFQLNGWPELLEVHCMEYDERIAAEDVIGFSLSDCPKLKRASLVESQCFDLTLQRLPNFQEFLVHDAGGISKSNKAIPIRKVNFKDLPAITQVQFNGWGFDQVRVENCPQLQCELSWTPPKQVESNVQSGALGAYRPTLVFSNGPFKRPEPTRQATLSEAQSLLDGLSKSIGITSLNLSCLPSQELDFSPVAACSTIKKIHLLKSSVSKSQMQQLSSLSGLEEIKAASFADDPTMLKSWTNLRSVELDMSDSIMRPTFVNGLPVFRAQAIRSQPIHLSSVKKLESFFKGQLSHASTVHFTDLPQLNDVVHVSKSIESIHIKGTPRLKGLLTFAPWPEDASIEGLTELEIFAAGGPRFDDHDFSGIEASDTLKSLTLGYCAMTPEGLSSIGKFTRLTALGLSGSAVNDETIKNWANLMALQSLTLDRTRITSKSIPWICKLGSLKHLSIDSLCFASITSEQIDALWSLQSLSLNGDDLEMERFAKMSKWRMLQLLRIENAKITREMLTRLLEYLPTSVRVLDLCNCKIEHDDLAEFLAALPTAVKLGVEGLDVPEELQVELLRVSRAVIESEGDFIRPGDGSFSMRTSFWPVRDNRTVTTFSSFMEYLSPANPSHGSVMVKPILFAPSPNIGSDLASP